MTRRAAPAVGLAFALILSAMEVQGQPDFASVSGAVLGPAGRTLSDVSLALSTAAGRVLLQTSGPSGEFTFAEVPPGDCRLVASRPGYAELTTETFRMEPGERRHFEIALRIAPISENVVIEARVMDGAANDPDESTELSLEQLDALPLPGDRFQEALPLLPGVVRDPEGRLSFNGARPSQSILLVNGTNVTDPLTGEFAIELPLKAIDTVEVYSIPYSAEYGQVTAAVAKVQTRGGTDDWDVDFGDLFPRPRFRDGKIRGIKSAVPQVQISGPIKKGKAWFSQGFAYRFVRSRVYDVEIGEDERSFESVDTFTQLDLRFAEKHHLTATFSYFPMEVDNFGIGALRPESAAPDFHSWGWNAAISERSFFSRTLVETTLAAKSFDVAVRPKGDGVPRLTPEGLRENYFNELNRESTRFELASAVTHAPSDFLGQHVIKVGASVAQTSFAGSDRSLPVEVLDGADRLLRRIEFQGDPGIGGSDVQVAAYVQDRFRPSERLGLDIGLRYDYDRLVDEHQLAPRIAGAFALDDGERTVVRAGWGLFFDHVFLHFDSFDRYQTRVETTYDATGEPTGAPLVFRPRIARADVEIPRSTNWNVELDRALFGNVRARVNYRERHGSKQMIVDRVEDGENGSLLLSSQGESITRELDVTLGIHRNDNELFASYVRARSTGDLNNFGTLYQDLRSPLLFRNESSLFELDVNNRILLWGVWNVKGDVRVSPGVEWRTGFPYTVLDENYVPEGAQNRGGRYPSFLSLDLRVTKGLTVKGRKVRIGFQLFNLGSHFNPREVVAHRGSPRFGEFLNSVDMGFGIRLSLGN